jgi:heme-degrading monooxygenase HmoA
MPELLKLEGLIATDLGRRIVDGEQEFVFVTIWRDYRSMTEWSGPDPSTARITEGFEDAVHDLSVEIYEGLSVAWPGVATPVPFSD